MSGPALRLPAVHIHTGHLLAIGMRMQTQGFRVGNASSATYLTANKAIFVPFWLPQPIIAKLLFAYNGATISGNIDVGIYTSDGTRLVSAGSTAQSGSANSIQTFDITDTELGPGLFYLAVVMDNTTGTLFRNGLSAAQLASFGSFVQASAFPLPATATFAAMDLAYNPTIGLTTRSFV